MNLFKAVVFKGRIIIASTIRYIPEPSNPGSLPCKAGDSPMIVIVI